MLIQWCVPSPLSGWSKLWLERDETTLYGSPSLTGTRRDGLGDADVDVHAALRRSSVPSSGRYLADVPCGPGRRRLR
jgi:hypothetical protein